jgi:DNA-binding MarR family transcriptional regulator
VRAKSKVRGSELLDGDGGVVMKEVFAALQTFFSSSTGWAIIICAVGSAAGFLPWIEVSSSGLLYLFHPRLNAFALVRGGDPCWHGVGATGVFAVLGLVLIATFSTKPIHLWKTVAVLASGVGVIVEICLLLSWAYQPRPTTQTMSVAGEIVASPSVCLSEGERWVSGEFLRNRIPICWLGRACTLPGKALAVGLSAWFLSGLHRSRLDGLRLTGDIVERFGVDSSAKSRAVSELVREGLVRIVRGGVGRCPVVTILPVEGKPALYMGPRIPLDWLGRACGLTAKDLATALAVWFLSGLREGRTSDLELTQKTLGHFHVNRSAKSRALTALEGAGLVRVRRDGRKDPHVTIVVPT